MNGNVSARKSAGTRLAPILAIAWFFTVSPVLGADKTYVNPRFGTTITYPSEIFTKAEPPPENGDGQRWTAADGASLAAWGQYNALDETPETLADAVSETIPQVTYRKVGSRWMVVSGFDGATIVYHRAEISLEGVIHAMELRYPASLSKHYDRLATKIADSLIGP